MYLGMCYSYERFRMGSKAYIPWCMVDMYYCFLSLIVQNSTCKYTKKKFSNAVITDEIFIRSGVKNILSNVISFNIYFLNIFQA